MLQYQETLLIHSASPVEIPSDGGIYSAAFMASAFEGGGKSAQGSSVFIATHFLVVEFLLVVLLPPRRIDDIFHALLFQRGVREADAISDNWSLTAQVVPFVANR